MSFILDILYFLDFYGIGYFCAKKLTKKTDTIPLDFSLSNKAFLFGLGGAFAGVCLKFSPKFKKKPLTDPYSDAKISKCAAQRG